MTKRDIIAFNYFKIFTEFEAKLKGYGYHNRGSSKTVIVDWNRVAKDYKLQLQSIVGDQSKEVEYLLNYPPKKMIVSNSAIKFIDLAEETNQERKLLTILCTVRNNLYHGGKYSQGELVGSERDIKLVEYANFILKKLKI